MHFLFAHAVQRIALIMQHIIKTPMWVCFECEGTFKPGPYFYFWFSMDAIDPFNSGHGEIVG